MPRSSNTKIFCKEMKTISTNVVDLKCKLADQLKITFYEEIKLIQSKFSDLINFLLIKLPL